MGNRALQHSSIYMMMKMMMMIIIDEFHASPKNSMTFIYTKPLTQIVAHARWSAHAWLLLAVSVVEILEPAASPVPARGRW